MLDFSPHLPSRPATDPQYVPDLVDRILTAARDAGASDVHLVPAADGLHMLWRVDGVLQPVSQFPAALIPRVCARLKVLSHLLTYQTDVPQEGRIQLESPQSQPSAAPLADDVEMRVSTFPTLFGEKVVVRLFAKSGHFRVLADLGLAEDVLTGLRQSLADTGGLILLTGPAGSGKTTTVYACLRELADKSAGSRSLVTMEDPIEAVLPGVSQSQVNPAAGFTLEAGLRSLVRQDPEVLMVGEIRDRTVADIVFQAALTGHLVLTTFHAGSAAGAISRLSDMGIEPYLLRSGVSTIVCQRLVRRLCECSEPVILSAQQAPDENLGLPVARFRKPVGCAQCGQTGYRGRVIVAELLKPEASELGRAILSRSDAEHLESLAVQAGMVTRWQRACAAIEAGLTSPAEVRRVLGWANSSSHARGERG